MVVAVVYACGRSVLTVPGPRVCGVVPSPRLTFGPVPVTTGRHSAGRPGPGRPPHLVVVSGGRHRISHSPREPGQGVIDGRVHDLRVDLAPHRGRPSREVGVVVYRVSGPKGLRVVDVVLVRGHPSPTVFDIRVHGRPVGLGHPSDLVPATTVGERDIEDATVVVLTDVTSPSPGRRVPGSVPDMPAGVTQAVTGPDTGAATGEPVSTSCTLLDGTDGLRGVTTAVSHMGDRRGVVRRSGPRVGLGSVDRGVGGRRRRRRRRYHRPPPRTPRSTVPSFRVTGRGRRTVPIRSTRNPRSRSGPRPGSNWSLKPSPG